MNDSKPASLTARRPPSQSEATAAVLHDADLCVKCGLCLPQCPTYDDSRSEADSPRGRIALAQGLFSESLQVTAKMEAHLDGCLSCRRCEAVCPARVPYGRILDATRAELLEQRPERGRKTKWIAALLVNKRMRSVLRFLLALTRRLGLLALLRRTGLLGTGRLARIESMLPSAEEKVELARVPGEPADLGRIGVFAACASDLFERDALRAVETLLVAVGFEVVQPSAQVCCGALYQHAGFRQQAGDLAHANVRAFTGFERIAGCATGCTATLQDYPDLVDDGVSFAARVQDFAQWLEPYRDRLRFRATRARVALHTPCTARNVVKSDANLRRLLECVPGLECIEIGAGSHCCGAAGSHFLTHPEASDRLLESRLAELSRIQPDVVLSANIGCSLHIAGGLRRRTRSAGSGHDRASRLASQVQHPAIFLAKLLDPSPPRP